jgi:hypothetical protein
MDLKTEYVARLFQKTSLKKIENYCLTRLWHKLDNDEIEFIPQQYINRHIDKYALTDVYLPQFGLHVEINEPAHYDSPERIEADKNRKYEIESKTGHKVVVIDCRHELRLIHRQIDELVIEINERIKEQRLDNSFKPWNPSIERNPEYWKAQKTINIEDKISMNSIEDICKLFDADFNKTKRGYLRRGGIALHKDSNYHLWWPSSITRQGWINKLSDDGLTISETHTEEMKRNEHYNDHLNSKQIRIVFFHYKDILGFTSYKFTGVFEYDKDKSKPDIGTVWSRISKELNIQLENN